MSRLGLRARVTFLFAGGAAVLSATLAVTTYEVVRHNVLHERQRSAVRATYFDAAVVRASISNDDADLVTALRALDSGQARRPLVHRHGKWFARTADDNLTRAVPAVLVATVDRGQAAVQRVRVQGQPLLVVGLPLTGGASFFEVQSLTEARITLRTVATALGAVALASTALAALLSWSVSRRVVQPLVSVSAAAERIGAGDYGARIDDTTDPDLAKLTRSFNRMVGQVSARIERERRFAADVSHELRSPLQTLQASAQVLRNHRAALDARTRAALDLLVEETERFVSLVQSLLELARSEAPREVAVVDVRALLERALVRHSLPVSLLAADPTVGSWTTDEQRLDRVLDNLLNNARQHGGGVVAVRATCSDGQLVVDVDDTGPGIPFEERAVVFDRFARGRSAHTRADSGGTGLGLAIVAEHMAALGGHVEVLDRPGGGARVRLILDGAG